MTLAAIRDLNAENSKEANVDNVKSTWVKSIENFKEPEVCSASRNLLFSFPGIGFLCFSLMSYLLCSYYLGLWQWTNERACVLVERLLIYTFGWFSHFLLFRVDGWSESGEVSCSSHLWMDIDSSIGHCFW